MSVNDPAVEISDIVLHGCLSRMSHNNRFNSEPKKLTAETTFLLLPLSRRKERLGPMELRREKGQINCLFINKFVPKVFSGFPFKSKFIHCPCPSE